MNIKITFAKEARFEVPPQQIVRAWTRLLCVMRFFMRSLALAMAELPPSAGARLNSAVLRSSRHPNQEGRGHW